MRIAKSLWIPRSHATLRAPTVRVLCRNQTSSEQRLTDEFFNMLKPEIPCCSSSTESVVCDVVSASISMRSGVSIKSVDTDGIVNTIREPKILTTARTTNADKGLQKTPPCVPPLYSPRITFRLCLQERPALAHVYSCTHPYKRLFRSWNSAPVFHRVTCWPRSFFLLQRNRFSPTRRS